ncbi:type II secretion system F family protein [Rhodanobacter sp. FW106-PBR-R2A-1-13]|uniref:type II secretion system F family protein n=1 Tax=Rhodanobacter sp. FW106-PBR-R2A-1-13 TaxID=3454845 RepID=UPI0034E52116
MITFRGLYEGIDRARIRLEFGMDGRLDFYEQIAQLYGNGIQLEEALKRIYLVASGGKANSSNALAVIAQDCIAGIGAGLPFSDVMRRWITEDEASIIAAGEETGDLLGALERCVASSQRRKALIAGVTQPLTLPLLLVVIELGLLGFISFYFAPQLLALAPINRFKGQTLQALQLAVFIQSWWWAILIPMVLLIIAFVISLPRWRGGSRDWDAINIAVEQDPRHVLRKPLRSLVDKYVPPYAIYRIYVASVFLDNVAQMQGQGIPLPRVLATVGKFASPWLQERIEDTLWGVNRGLPLGDALESAGHEFPDAGSIAFIRILESSDATGQALQRFTARWMVQNTRKVSQIAMWLRLIVFLAFGMTLTLFFGAVYGVSQMGKS